MKPLACFGPLLLCVVSNQVAKAESGMIRLEVAGSTLEGLPLRWTNQQALLLGRDGHLWNFHPQQAKDLVRTSDRFRSYSQAEIRGRLMSEFGRQFEVTGTGHYLVVHPAGERDVWAQRFEELYRSFVHYFAVRGFRPERPAYPLIAVVLPDREQFVRHALEGGVRLPSSALGYYSPASNRILMYDQGVGTNFNSSWNLTATVIIHEAAHQSAFNSGIHNRFAPQPRWLVEGLGMLFEAKGVYDSRRYPGRADRVNQPRLAAFRKQARQRAQGWLAELISSDRVFRSDLGTAYPQAWALSFYLVETQPQKYFQLLRKTAGRPAFAAYTSPQRLKDFTDVFGHDLRMLEAQMLRYLESVD